jgi:hypothetical protein
MILRASGRRPAHRGHGGNAEPLRPRPGAGRRLATTRCSRTSARHPRR